MSRTVSTWSMFGLVAVGGLVGASLRYLTGAIAGEALAVTVLVNATGCFLLGIILYDARTSARFSIRTRYLFGAGFCSSWTTYSTFVADIALSDPSIATLYFGTSYGAGIIGVLASYAVVDRVNHGGVH